MLRKNKPRGDLLPIYSTTKIDGKTFNLAEHVDTYPQARLAQAEYQCEGEYARIEVVEKHRLYYVWCRKGRTKTPRTLSGEVVKRRKSRPRLRLA